MPAVYASITDRWHSSFLIKPMFICVMKLAFERFVRVFVSELEDRMMLLGGLCLLVPDDESIYKKI